MRRLGGLGGVLVTGHRGFIGRHFAAHHQAAGDDVTGIDIVDGIDVRDWFRCSSTHFDLVIHCAAVVGGRQKIEGAPLELAVDLAIDAELFGWALRTRPGRIVYFSSSAAYPVDLQRGALIGRLSEGDISLTNIGAPDLTYGWAKLTGEMLAGHAARQGLRVHVFRPFSGYGSDQGQEYPFPAFVARALRCADPFPVWGSGRQARDFIHVDDIVGAVNAAIARDVVGPVNLGWGRATRFDELAHMCMAAAGYRGRVVTDETKPVGVHHRVADPTKMLAFYVPKVTLEQGIARAIEDRLAHVAA